MKSFPSACALCLAVPCLASSSAFAVDISRINSQKRRVVNKIHHFATSTFGSEPNNIDAAAILAKYGLQSAQESTPKATLHGSIQDRRAQFYKSLFSKTLQVAFIIFASKVSNNRIRFGANYSMGGAYSITYVHAMVWSIGSIISIGAVSSDWIRSFG